MSLEWTVAHANPPAAIQGTDDRKIEVQSLGVTWFDCYVNALSGVVGYMCW
jgi:hypothetical protein